MLHLLLKSDCLSVTLYVGL